MVSWEKLALKFWLISKTLKRSSDARTSAACICALCNIALPVFVTRFHMKLFISFLPILCLRKSGYVPQLSSRLDSRARSLSSNRLFQLIDFSFIADIFITTGSPWFWYDKIHPWLMKKNLLFLNDVSRQWNAKFYRRDPPSFLILSLFSLYGVIVDTFYQVYILVLMEWGFML